MMNEMASVDVDSRNECDCITLKLRQALPSDLEQLDELEYDAVDDEPFSRRQLQHLLTRAHALTLVLEDTQHALHHEQSLLGYGMLLFRQGSVSARLYSFALHPCIRRKGQGRRLLTALEDHAAQRQCRRMVLEVRADNRAALSLYRASGYRALKWVDQFYHDGCAAYRMSKPLVQSLSF